MTRTADRHTHTNRLIHETSPYLLQHAHNPVDWHPWDDEALERAREENKLILLSIGYAACHWCHVMERESFEDESIATLMNENFVSIKVDREERPDLDEIYMAATQLLNRGQGGWPMTVFLTPDLEPVFAGTYFPPQDMYGRPGFVSVLEQVARAWREDPQGLRIRAREFTEHLRRTRSVGPALTVGEDALRKALDDYRDDFDPQYGGFGGAPKFPPSVGLTLLLRLHRRFDESHALDMAIKTLEGMARGGMYDHIGGGFARYSTDRRWLVPHFEKMLYDNALLARAYLEGYQATGDEFLGRIAVETLDYVLRDMTDPGGGFYSSTDADSEGEEGRFFVWTPQQVSEVLEAEEARRLCGYYDITAGGNWEGKSIPNTPRSVEDVASDLGISPNELTRTLEAARPKLYEARERRPKPGLDDKILTAWNGLMIGALAEGYRVLGHRRYLEAAGSAARFILDHLSRDDGGLLRSYRDGRARFNGYLEDYAYLGEGLLDLYEASGDTRWLRESERLLERALKDFGDEPNGAFYSTARDHENLLMRFADGTDGATPAANAAAAHVLARLSYHLDRADLRHRAGRAIRAFGSLISRYPRGFAKSLIVVDFLLEGPVELAFVGGRDSPELEALERAVAAHYLPNRIQAILDPEGDAEASELPLLQGKDLVDGEPALYVCRNFACRAPVTEPAAVASELPVDLDAASSHGSITEPLAGRATAEGTGRYASRFSPHGHNLVGTTGLVASRIGFGGYRVHERSPEHRAALSQALRSGVNLIDTSSNYMDGGSERLIAGVLRDLIDDGEISREEIVVVSKLGYLQGSAYEEARRREEEGKPFPDVVKHEDGLWHCIHPDFLRFELRRSLDRLELETLDLCLLHNPEYFLADAARHGTGIDEAREELYRRIALAFEYLESEVSEGRLAGYGVSSNTLPSRADAPEAVSIDELAAAARRAAGDDHHLRAIQLPLNPIECGAVLERNSGPDSSRSVLESAEDHGIAVLVNRPLNATLDGTLHRLADVPAPANHIDLGSALDRLTDLELAFAAEIAPKLPEEGLAADPGRIFRLAEQLQQLRTHTKSLAHWSQVEAQVRYTIGATVGLLNASLRGELAARWSDWREGYLEELEDVLRAFREEAAERSREFAASLNALLGPWIPTERRSESLARKALYLVASTPGVGCTLNGMRAPDYVRDAIEVLDWPPMESTENIYRAVTEAL